MSSAGHSEGCPGSSSAGDAGATEPLGLLGVGREGA